MLSHSNTDLSSQTDWVLVISPSAVSSSRLTTFTENLHEKGITVELRLGKIPNNIYLNLQLTDDAVNYFSKLYSINFSSYQLIPSSSVHFNFQQISSTDHRPQFTRMMGVATSMERILIGHEVLKDVEFGSGEFDYGLDKLIKLGEVKTAYPLHDGSYRYSKSDEDQWLNDRQFLYKYWANFSVWYKEQPLDLIQKYYGPEVAFYFAWMGFYTKMLIPAAIVGLIIFFLGIITFVMVRNERAEGICDSDYIVCPQCHLDGYCVSKSLKDSCFYARFSIFFDNYSTVCYAVLMSFWSTLFLNMWRRYESMQKLRWNIDPEETDTKYRREYKETTKTLKTSSVTGNLIPHSSTTKQVLRITISCGICLLFMTAVGIALFSVIMFNVFMSAMLDVTTLDFLETPMAGVMACVASILQVIHISLIGMFYAQISEWLTRLENPRTQTEFDTSVVYKRCFLGFVNNLTPLFYIAFIKGRFYLPMNRVTSTRANTDICHPSGCLVALCMQLFFLMVIKTFSSNLIFFMMRKLMKKFKTQSSSEGPQYEEEFKLLPASPYLLTTEFMEATIQYGFVTCFVAAFTLAPVIALISNCIQLRLTAYKLLTKYRRPVPKKQCGIGPWNYVLDIITHMGVATNAFVLAFTSDTVAREIYKNTHEGSMEGFIKSTLSVFNLNDWVHRDFAEQVINATNSTMCYYRALRYPPDHPNKYKLRPEYWFELGIRLLCVIIFEHIIWVLNGFLSYFIPDVPPTVKEKLHHDKMAERNLKLKLWAEKAKANKTKKIQLRRRANKLQ